MWKVVFFIEIVADKETCEIVWAGTLDRSRQALTTKETSSHDGTQNQIRCKAQKPSYQLQVLDSRSASDLD
ncbi:MAG: hypothetical protein IJG33_16685 [Selenomonadaceae bacterium]|nr:hypothetical protein [Selenomonadaceae bacterium]